MATIHETRADFRLLFQKADIFDHSDPRRTVWMLAEKDVSGIAVHIFSEKPPIEIEQEGFLPWAGQWIRRFVHILTGQKPPQTLPYVPYESAIIGIQIHIHDNKIESVVWNPVPDEDGFQNDDPDLPESPTVQVLIGNIDAYRPIPPSERIATDDSPQTDAHFDPLDDPPF